MSAMAAQALTSGGNVVSMDPNIWSNLQNYDPNHDLLETIFGKLPFRDFFQLRVVCREWHRLASDQKFLERSFTELTPKPYFVLTSHYAREPAGDRYGPRDEFQRHGLLSYEASCSRWSWTWLPLLTMVRDSLAMEGLLYSGNDQVINLHTREFRTLPQLPPDPSTSPSTTFSRPWIYVGMALDRSESPYTFQIVLRRENHTMIYDSRTNSWTQKGSLTNHQRIRSSLLSPYVPSCAHCNGFLYITGHSWYTDHEFINGQDWAMRYDLEREIWGKIRLPQRVDESFYRDFYVGAWQGRLLGVTTSTLHRPPGSVKVWELINIDHPEQDWTKVASMPEYLYEWLKIYDYYEEGRYAGRALIDSTTRGCSFCGEYVLLYSWLNAESRAEIRFVMCNLDTKDDDWSKLVWTRGRVPLEMFSISKERHWPDSQPDIVSLALEDID